jgi:hypothetical protein
MLTSACQRQAPAATDAIISIEERYLSGFGQEGYTLSVRRDGCAGFEGRSGTLEGRYVGSFGLAELSVLFNGLKFETESRPGRRFLDASVLYLKVEREAGAPIVVYGKNVVDWQAKAIIDGFAFSTHWIRDKSVRAHNTIHAPSCPRFLVS